jgi:alkylhydroperoxidase family enzyme
MLKERGMRKTLIFGLVIHACALAPAFADGSASRLPDIPKEKLDQLTAARGAQGQQLINLSLTTGHSMKLQGTGRVAMVLRNETIVSRELVELAILRTAWNVGSEYEYLQHRKLSMGCKYSQAKIDAIPAWVNAKVYEDKERAMLAFADEMTLKTGDVTDAAWEAMTKHYSPREIVELSTAIGNYYGNGLLTKALRVKLETTDRVSSQGNC